MILRHEKLEFLNQIRPDRHLVTTCYLNVDGRQQTSTDYRLLLKDAAREVLEDLEDYGLEEDVKEAARKDAERIRAYVENEFDREGARGLAIFACGPEDLWEVLPLPFPVPTRMIQDTSPYIRPLSMLLDEHPRFCAVLVDREQANIYEITMGQVEETTTVQDDVPDQVRAGGWQGYDEKRISRHIEDHVHRHYKHVAQAAFDVFRREGFDWLLVGGYREALNEFTAHLHSYLQERLKTTFEIDPTAPKSEVLERLRAEAAALERAQEEALVEEVVTEARKNGLATLGLEPTLAALHRGAVHTLVVDHGASAEGYRCGDCGRLSGEGDTCPACRGENVEEVPHLLDSAIEMALSQGSQVEHLRHGEGLEDGPLAARLRFRLAVEGSTAT